ncbi:MAG: hypothetical protein K2J80_13145, partial [Oscillospiraceae bacterium]|nr:hypothetical protein [Oscillospiraceae bacterium]
MIKTVTLVGKELKADGLGGFNTVVQNLSGGALYASKYPNIVPGADNVAEIPTGTSKLISTTNGTVYLLGTGKAELTGQDYDGVNSSGGGGSAVGGDGSLSAVIGYVNEQDAIHLEASKTYTDDKLAEKANKLDIPTTLPANGGNASTVNGHTVNADVPANAKFTDTTYSAMTGATASAAGKSGLVPTPAAGAQAKYLRGDGTWQTPPDTNTTYESMTGASASATGKVGLVPAPAAGAQAKYLRGDGTWQTPPDTNTTYSSMTGATASAAGTAGLVPAPAAGKQSSFRRGD